jgi:hypothetical protein
MGKELEMTDEGGSICPSSSILPTWLPSPSKVQAFSRSGRPAQPPRLLHTADVCQLEVALVGASPRGNHSLFGLEVATLGQGPDCPSVNERNSIDDEYAPAVFQVRSPVRDRWVGM